MRHVLHAYWWDGKYRIGSYISAAIGQLSIEHLLVESVCSTILSIKAQKQLESIS